MLIHRIAHPLVLCPDAGRSVGPYNASRVAEHIGHERPFTNSLQEVADFLCARLDSSHTPPPQQEGQRLIAGREQSVFTSVVQASEWFQDGVELMQAAGFRWFTYEIADKYVRNTPTQAVAFLRRARLLSITDIPFSSDPDYYYCTYCGYSLGCSCYDECDGCARIYADCFCWGEDDGIVNCEGCYEQPWSCRC